jgi:hypothetical protein
MICSLRLWLATCVPGAEKAPSVRRPTVSGMSRMASGNDVADSNSALTCLAQSAIQKNRDIQRRVHGRPPSGWSVPTQEAGATAAV